MLPSVLINYPQSPKDFMNKPSSLDFGQQTRIQTMEGEDYEPMLVRKEYLRAEEMIRQSTILIVTGSKGEGI